jgi:hypothetical protein
MDGYIYSVFSFTETDNEVIQYELAQGDPLMLFHEHVNDES